MNSCRSPTVSPVSPGLSGALRRSWGLDFGTLGLTLSPLSLAGALARSRSQLSQRSLDGLRWSLRDSLRDSRWSRFRDFCSPSGSPSWSPSWSPFGSPSWGMSVDPATRLKSHNAGNTRSTCSGRPWSLAIIIGPFVNSKAASRFEALVKASKGRGLQPKLTAARREIDRQPSDRPGLPRVYTAEDGTLDELLASLSHRQAS